MGTSILIIKLRHKYKKKYKWTKFEWHTQSESIENVKEKFINSDVTLNKELIKIEYIKVMISHNLKKFPFYEL